MNDCTVIDWVVRGPAIAMIAVGAIGLLVTAWSLLKGTPIDPLASLQWCGGAMLAGGAVLGIYAVVRDLVGNCI